MVDGIQKGQQSLKMEIATEVVMANVEKTNEFHCLWARKAGKGRHCLLRAA